MGTITPLTPHPRPGAWRAEDVARLREVAARECHLLQLALTSLDAGGAFDAGGADHDIPACQYQLARIEWLIDELLGATGAEEAADGEEEPA